MKVRDTTLPEVLIVEPDVFSDARGFFFESYRADRYAEAGIALPFVQDNCSGSQEGTVRGLHYQLDQPQGKLIRVVRGTIYDVAVDIRRGSPSFARWEAFELSEENKLQIWVPPGFAHGFCVTSEFAEVEYKCTDFYAPADQRGIAWNDPSLAIPWPVATPILSENDRSYLPLSAPREDLPSYPT